MQKNVASQKLTLFAFIPSTGLPKTGDAANITAYVSKDDGSVTVLADTSAAELDATNAKGLYTFDVAQAETNATKLVFSAKSSTSDVSLVPQIIYPDAPNFSLLVIDASGRVDVSKLSGTSQTARDLGASVLLSPGTGTGQVNLSSGAVPVTGDLTATMKTSVNAEVVDGLNVDTYAEPGQEAPPATASIVRKLGWLFKLARNKKTQTATTLSIFADDGTTVDAKASVSDDGTTFIQNEIASGP